MTSNTELATPTLAKHLFRNGGYVSAADILASVTFAWTAEPWVYCTSVAPTWSCVAGALEALNSEFSESIGNDWRYAVQSVLQYHNVG